MQARVRSCSIPTRRRLLLGVVAVAVAGACVPPAVATGTERMVTIASGVWNGTPWFARASVSRSDEVINVCHEISYGGKGAGGTRSLSSGCGGFLRHRNPSAPSFSYGIGLSFVAHCPDTFWAIGAVVPSAAEVSVRLTTGATARGRTIAPPAGLPKSVRFSVMHLRIPCKTRAALVVARDARGRVVGRQSLPRSTEGPVYRTPSSRRVAVGGSWRTTTATDATTIAAPIRMRSVSDSSRKSTPRMMATTGFT